MLNRHEQSVQISIGLPWRGSPILPKMQRRDAVGRTKKLGLMLGLVAVAPGVGPGLCLAQTARDLEGTWKLASARISLEGKTRDLFGAHPGGIMIFDRGARFVQVIITSDLPRFASRGRESGTAEENQAVVQGSIAYFGTYAVDAGGIVKLHVESSTFPNMSGTDQSRSIKLSGDEMTWANATPAVGSGVAEQIWVRTP
jgi:hypothetical protein